MQPFDEYRNKSIEYDFIIETKCKVNDVNFRELNEKINLLTSNEDLLKIYFPKISLGRVYPKYSINKNKQLLSIIFGISLIDCEDRPTIAELIDNAKQFIIKLDKNLEMEMNIRKEEIEVDVLTENVNDIDKVLVTNSKVVMMNNNDRKELKLTDDGVVEKYTNNTIDGIMPFSKLGVIRECKNLLANGYKFLNENDESDEIIKNIQDNPEQVKQDLKDTINDVDEIQDLKDELDDKVSMLNESADKSYILVVYTKLNNDYEPDVTIGNIDNGEYQYANSLEDSARFDKETAEFYANDYKDKNNDHILKAVSIDDIKTLNGLYESLDEHSENDINDDNIDNIDINDDIDNTEDIVDDTNTEFPSTDYTNIELAKHDLVGLDFKSNLTPEQLTWIQTNINDVDIIEQNLKDIINIVANNDDDTVISIDKYLTRLNNILNEGE